MRILKGTVTGVLMAALALTLIAAPASVYAASSPTATQTATTQDQTITLKSSSKTVKAKKLKKKAQKIKLSATSDSGTAVTFAKKASSIKGSNKKATKNAKKYITYKSGKITLKKGLPKGTYTVSFKVSVAASTGYNAATKTVKYTIKVK